MERIIFHIDVNSAFLSWTATKRVKFGIYPDLRDIPAVIGGKEQSRHGIVLAKSIPAKNYGIKTGEPLFKALEKCPNLKIVHPDFQLYKFYSDKLFEVCTSLSPDAEKFSVDELFLDCTYVGVNRNNMLEKAKALSEKIKKELGFTVNIGISSNKLLAKMASDFEKPDKIHTLFPEEISEKMWNLPVSDLFMVGRKTKEKLENIGIKTIGQLAKCERKFLYSYLKQHGNLIWYYANGIDVSKVSVVSEKQKSLGNGITLPKDIYDSKSAHTILLGLAEKAGERLRKEGFESYLISVTIKSKELDVFSHQKILNSPISSTNDIFYFAKKVFDEMWNEEPIRALTITLSELTSKDNFQCVFFENSYSTKQKETDIQIDNIRKKFGHDSILRASLLNTHLSEKITNAQDTQLNSRLNTAR